MHSVEWGAIFCRICASCSSWLRAVLCTTPRESGASGRGKCARRFGSSHQLHTRRMHSQRCPCCERVEVQRKQQKCIHTIYAHTYAAATGATKHTHIHTHTFMCASAIHTCAYTHTYAYTHTVICVHIRDMHMYIHVRMPIYAHIHNPSRDCH